MKARKKLLNGLFISLSSLFAIGSTISCSPNNYVNIVKDVESIECEANYLSAFQNEQLDFFQSKIVNSDLIWEKNEQIFENGNFVFFVDSYEINCINLEFFYKPISKFYLIKFTFEDNTIINSFNKKVLEELMVKNVLSNFKNEMTATYSLGTDEIYIPFSVDDKSIEIVKDAYASFWSSWGVPNSSTRESKFVFHITNDVVREAVMTNNNKSDARVVVTDVHLNDLYYLPLIEVIKTPIWHSWYFQNKLTLNENEVFNDNSGKSFNLLLPEGADAGQEWWNGLISIVGLAQFATNIALMFCAGSSISWISELGYKALTKFAAGKTGLAIVKGFVKAWKEENLEVDVEGTIENIKKFGIKTTINQTINLLKPTNISIEGKVKYNAKATNLFGQESKAKIYDLAGFATADVTWIEYRQIDFGENNEQQV